MAVRLNPYLNFRNEAREAMAFYQSVFGGELNVSTFGEFGLSHTPADDELVMHSQLETPDGFTLMGADTPSNMESGPRGGMSVSLSGDDEAKLRGWWEQLSEGGNVVAPFEKAPWGDTFGMCADRFGIDWLVNATGAGPS